MTVGSPTSQKGSSTLHRLYSRFGTLIHELAKFGVVGAVNAALDILLFNYLHFGVHLGPLTAKTLSTVAAATSSYFMNRHWSFRHRARSGFGREYGLFILLSAVGLAITLTPLAVARYALDMTSPLALNLAGNVIGLGFGTIWRFWSFKRWVFLPAALEEHPADPYEGEQQADDAAAANATV